jgi:tripartite-type tricarboxylate transporter receptor subunit TctC
MEFSMPSSVCLSKHACAAILVAAAGATTAQPYPSRPIRLVVPFAPGGSADFVGRLVGQKLSETVGQQVVVENRGGGSGMIGNEQVAKSVPDGYTLTIGTLGPFAVNQSLFGKMPYDPVRDFAPVTLTGSASHVLVAHPSIPVTTVKDLIALAQARPGQLTFASSGIGNATHLTGELFKYLAKVNMVHVPYKGGGPAMTDLMGGQVSFSFASMPSALPHVRSGRLRAIAVSAGKRSPAIPELPTVAESGLPGFASEDWQGILAPAKTPPEIVARLNGELQRVLGLPELKEKLIAAGFEARTSTPEGFADFIKAETVKWARVVKEAGIKAE